MGRTLALGLIVFGGMARLSAQPPAGPMDEAELRAIWRARVFADVEQRLAEQPGFARPLPPAEIDDRVIAQAELAAQGRLARQPWTDEQFEQWVFRQHGNAAEARKRLNSQLRTQLGTIDRMCNLTDAQKEKLQLAGRGDIKRFFDRYETVKRKYQSIEPDMQNLQQDTRLLQMALQGGLFQEDSLLLKALPNTLTGEQFARYDAVARERRASRHRATVEQAVAMLHQSVPLRDAQWRQLITLMANETKPSRTSGPYDAYVVLWQLGRLPEERLKPLFSEAQWKRVNAQLARYQQMEPMLKQSGQLLDEDDEADRKE